MDKLEQYDIDIVIPWVDSSDPLWLADKRKYENIKSANEDVSDARYRNDGTLKYLLRSIEKYMPWIRTVHFVTVGHLPEWLDSSATGLHIVKHTDYIPEQYLPTFSSHTIELNMHRIPGLAEHFIYFNDDMLLLRPNSREDYFQNGLPVDFAVETALIGKRYQSIAGVSLSNAEIINQHFNKHQVMKRNLNKWFNFHYGLHMFKTLALLPWGFFSDFSYAHTVNPYLKKTFEEVWKKEYDVLDATCRHKFRNMSDVNQWLMRDWQLANGDFVPSNPNKGKTFNIKADLSDIKNAIDEKKYSIICINDVNYETITDYDKVIDELNGILEAFLPEKSRFERKQMP